VSTNEPGGPLTPAPGGVCANGHPMAADAAFCPSCGPLPVPTGPTYGVMPTPGYPYGPGPAYLPSASPTTNGMAIASLVLGILWIYWIGSLLALVFGYIALKQIRRRNEAGRGLALAGVILGWVGAAFLVLVVILVIAASGSGGLNVVARGLIR
jgi:Domain of unknown function (DUF4190)